ncbi:hypothetical protein PR048_012170 [Dryococelus australis]|uniref:Uncharacterized protein n=1 Tax=Dryococelus australis TaxID=614101 RepID=A0ABQ9HNP1_9NEOP|nr:hypothetical protein PR048_012170 [Dryococelus australis]
MLDATTLFHWENERYVTISQNVDDWSANNLADSFQDKIDVKNVYTEVEFAIGSHFIRHAQDNFEPIADFQGDRCNTAIRSFIRDALTVACDSVFEGLRMGGGEGLQYLIDLNPVNHVSRNDVSHRLTNNGNPFPRDSCIVTDFVRRQILDRTEFYGTIAWPTRSPDVTLLDYLLWGHIKGVIYETPVESEEDLLARIMAAADLGLPGIGDRVYQKMVLRYRVCVDVTGRHIDPFLRGRRQREMWWCFVRRGETVQKALHTKHLAKFSYPPLTLPVPAVVACGELFRGKLVLAQCCTLFVQAAGTKRYCKLVTLKSDRLRIVAGRLFELGRGLQSIQATPKTWIGTLREFNDLYPRLHNPLYSQTSGVCSLAVAPVLPHISQYGIRFLFPCKSAIGTESSRVCIINSHPIAKVTSVYTRLKSILKAGIDKDVNVKCIKCAIAPKHQALNWRSVFSVCCIYQWDF